MGRRAGTRPRNTISLDTAKNYLHYIALWFANAATITFINKPIHEVAKDDLGLIYEQFENYISELCSYQDIPRDRVLEWIPIPLTPNDRRELMTVGSAINMLYNAMQGKVEVLPLPPALSLEFAEYVRTLLPQAKDTALKRKAVGISTDVLALSIIGAAVTHTYRVAEGKKDEHGYVFVDVYNPGIVDVPNLIGMTKTVVRRVMRGNGSNIVVYVGVAATLVLNIGRKLRETEGHSRYSSIRITRSGNKTMLKAFEIVDLTSLARTMMKLGIASSIYNLILRYPSADEVRKEHRFRTLRSFIESLAHAVLVYHSTNNVEELYKVLRTLTSERFDSDMGSCLGNVWSEIKEELLGLRI